MPKYNSRIKRLESRYGLESVDVLAWIDAGRFYDELTEEERKAYKKYKESLGGAADDIAGAELDVLFCEKTEGEAYHFRLTKRKKPPTRAELDQIIRELEEYVLESI